MNPLSAHCESLIQTLVTMVEARNPYNLDHCKLVAHYSDLLARWAGLDDAARERLQSAARLHTLALLLQMEEKKPHQGIPITDLGLATGREQPSHQREEEILRKILGPVDGLQDCIPIILQRHEWYDGRGSLWGLRGEQIRVEARLLAVADAFVDLATPKAHRTPLSLSEVLRCLTEKSGTQFEPRFVEGMAHVVDMEGERWGTFSRERRFEEARCRHWLGLGHFHRQVAEIDWSLRCYQSAQRLAQRMKDVDLEMDAVAGQFMVHCDSGDMNRARQTLNSIRPQMGDAERHLRQRFLLMWAVLDWLSGQEENGEQILEDLVAQHAADRDPARLLTVVAHLANLLLISRGAHDPKHLHWLRRCMQIASRHDLFDVIEQYRNQTIPLLLSAVQNDIEAVLARALLTLMGEPCQEAVLERIADSHPREWARPLSSVPVAAPVVATRDAEGDEAARPPAPSTVEPVEASAPAAMPTGGTPPPAVSSPDRTVRALCLGSFYLESCGQRIRDEDWPSQKAMKLIAMVASRGHSPVPEATLRDVFWPESDEARARHSLRNAIHQARSVLRILPGGKERPDLLERSRRSETLSLSRDVFLDVEAFEAAWTAGSRLHGEGRIVEAAERLDLAVSLYRGPFLDGYLDEWVLNVRTHLAEVYLKSLTLLARCQLMSGNADAAEATARKAIAEDDLREEAHAIVLEALRTLGRRAEALRFYQDSVVHFQREIGITPTTLSNLYDSLLV